MPPFDELSLRHLPDISDASFSFQIPNVSKDDFLLGHDDDDEKDFFKSIDDSLATLGPSRASHAPLTLGELTPKPSAGSTAAPEPHPASSTPTERDSRHKPKQHPQGIGKTARARPVVAKPKPTLGLAAKLPEVAKAEASPVAARLESLRVEVEMLNDEPGEPMPSTSCPDVSPIGGSEPGLEKPLGSKQERLITKPKRTVAAGGITKTRSKPASSTLAFPRKVRPAPQYLPSQPPAEPTSRGPAGLDAQDPDLSISSSITGGVAERLVMYSQKLISSFGLYNSENISSHSTGAPEPRESQPQTTVTSEDTPSGTNDPFTLSQISPRKPSPACPFSPATCPASPMRPSSKRPVSNTSSYQPSKKGKTSAALKAVDVPALKRSTGRHAATILASSGGGSTRPRALKGARVRPQPGGRAQRAGPGDSLGSSSGSRGASTSTRFSRADKDDAAEGSARVREPGGGSAGVGAALDAHAQQRDKRIAVAPVNPTKPVGFRFQLDARMEARKAEYEKERSVQKQRTHHHQPAPVPDFKTLHAQHDAEVALRKENIHPIFPLPVELNTDGRAKEREKFDLRMKEKERELERALEERRREREENEEREVRELRKKAVPRAHEVPEWYKEAPKRKNRDVDSIVD